MEKIKVMIVDDHAILRMGLASLLNAKKDIEVIGEANSGAAALKKAPKLKPDVIVMDLIMPEMDGAETTRRLKELMPEARILILTTFGTADGIAHALAAGAMGAVLKSVEFADLADAIRKVAAGEKVVDDEIKRILKTEPAIEPLSPTSGKFSRPSSTASQMPRSRPCSASASTWSRNTTRSSSKSWASPTELRPSPSR